jgi:hypothetical protein
LPDSPAPRRTASLSRPALRAGPFGGVDPPECCAASWSYSSNHNPLGNCINAGPETDPGSNSARTRFLSSRLAAQFHCRNTGPAATPARGTGDICLGRLAPPRGGRHQLPPTFPRLPGIIPVALPTGFSDWPSALRLIASSGFGSVCSSVTRIAFLPCAALRRSWEFRIQLPCGFRLLHPCMMSIIGCLLQRGSSPFYFPGFATRFSSGSGFSYVSFPIHILLPVP